MPNPLVLGEFRRTLDARFRISVPNELVAGMGAHDGEYLLTKERPGALSLWPAEPWQQHFSEGLQILEQKLRASGLRDRLVELQQLGRLLSTRQRRVTMGGRGRLVIPEGFREFLGAPAETDLMVVGAAVCVEIWRPDAWSQQLEDDIPRFRELFDQLTR